MGSSDVDGIPIDVRCDFFSGEKDMGRSGDRGFLYVDARVIVPQRLWGRDVELDEEASYIS